MSASEYRMRCLGIALVVATAACAGARKDASSPRREAAPLGYQWVVRDEENRFRYTHAGDVHPTKAEARAALNEHLKHFPWQRPHAEIIRIESTEGDRRE